uniref:Uncharacterized protein n=1 Tax=Parascaris equorum TaxID=6256 RepID=A0A914S2U0_PAREQ
MVKSEFCVFFFVLGTFSVLGLHIGRTQSAGVKGYTHEITTIDPKLNIYHDCEDGLKPCQRKVTIYIPDKFVYSGKTPKTLYDAGTIQLAGKFKGETRDCLN